MRVLSHRGYWKSPEEKNSRIAFERSFELGFGTETDLRDLARALVVSHDPPAADAMPAEELFALHQRHQSSLPLALNVKADGLQGMLAEQLQRFAPTEVFVFDMSIPDTLHWLRAGIPVFVRHSDVEPEPVLYDRAAGVWLDAFHSDWWGHDDVARHLEAGKRVCIVSPDLHRRPHTAVWESLARAPFAGADEVMICTDFPEDARAFFSAAGHVS